MKKKALKKTIIREIFESKARFFSILGIILLGVCFYAGIKATGPDMINTADTYYRKTRLMDGKILSTMGLGDEDIEIIKKDPNILDYEVMYSQDVNLVKDNRVVHFLSYDRKNEKRLNNYAVVEGRMPKKAGEIVLDNRAALLKQYKIGDTYTIDAEKKVTDNFKKTSFKVVGFVNSPMYIENVSRGNTTVGKGSIDSFAVIPVEDFNLDVYTEIYVRYKNTQKWQAYSEEYDKKVEKNQKELKKKFKKRPSERLEEVKKEAEPPLKKGKDEIQQGEKKLAEAKADLEKGQKELQEGKQKYTDSEVAYQNKIAQGEAELAQSQKTLENGRAEITKKEAELNQAKNQVGQAKTQLDVAAKELEKNGLSPTTDVQMLYGKMAELQQLVDLLTGTANDMTGTINGIPDGEMIPTEKLQQWSGSLSNPFVDLSEAQAGIMGLSGVPMSPETRGMALGIPPKLVGASAGFKEQIPGLQKGIDGLVPYQQGMIKYEQGRNQVNIGTNQLEVAKQQIIAGEQALKEGQSKLAQGRIDGQGQLAQAKGTLNEAETKLADGEKKLKEEATKLEDAKKELRSKEKELNDIKKPKYFYFSREENPGYAEYRENSKRISSIATVFPVFFFMIAALVSLTTMTRMVDEKRGEIGTLKALGYTNFEIAQKYIVYATTASVIGSVVGLLIGYHVFPTVIFNAYGSLYNLPPVIITYYASYTIQSLIVALMCTLISAMIVLRVDLFSTPAKLMRPKAPKAGKRIILERITLIWKRLNFNQKVTARNLFRYKQRMFMTVFGIAGCMALMITGFGLRDSITDVVDIQFNKLWHYQGIVTYNDEATSKDTKEYEKELKQTNNYKDRLTLAQQSMRIMKKGVTTQEVTIDVPKTKHNLDEFVLFNNRKTGEKYEISDNGVIINEKIGKMFKIKAGDTFELTDSRNRKYPVKVDKVVENYAMHFVYMTPTYYEKVFNKKPVYNADLILFNKDLTKKQEDKVTSSLMEHEKVVNVTFLSETSNAMDDTIDSLNIVVWVLIISAATLAFIVLYNLTNINISERIRELSTIKVLGFYDNEVTRYVYRENDILTILGIAAGCIVGKLLHGFVLQTAEVDMLMFSPTIHITSYIYSGLLTIFFSFIVMIVMHRKLRRVDMIEALKSNE